MAQTPPPAVEGVSVAADGSDGGAVSVSWTVLPARWAVEGYRVAGERVGAGGDPWTEVRPASGPPVRFTGLAPGGYRFRVRADNSAGEGAWSPWVDATVELPPPVLVGFHSWNIGPPTSCTAGAIPRASTRRAR